MGFVEDNPQKLEQSKQQILTTLNFFERLLDEQPYFGSDRLTLADIVAGTAVPILPSLGVSLDDFSKLNAWSERLSERPTWQNTQPSPEEIEAFIPQMKTLMAAYLAYFNP